MLIKKILKQTKFLMFDVIIKHFYALIKYDLVWEIFFNANSIWFNLRDFFICCVTHVKKLY